MTRGDQRIERYPGAAMVEADHSTWWMHRPGEEFTAPVWLEGWDSQSLWGWELGSYFLSLLPNGSSDDTAPNHFGQPFAHIGPVVRAIAGTTNADPLTICRALEVLPTPGPVPTDSELIGIRAEAHEMGANDYASGQLAACEWLLGRAALCPGSGWAWNIGSRPDRAIIAAESEMNTGDLYLDPGGPLTQYRRGVDEVLGRIVVGFWPDRS